MCIHHQLRFITWRHIIQLTDSSSYSCGDYHEANWDDLGYLRVHMSEGVIKYEGIEIDMWVVV